MVQKRHGFEVRVETARQLDNSQGLDISALPDHGENFEKPHALMDRC
jgi:hypothetical protein